MDDDLLAREFGEHRRRLHAVAYRMLGSDAEADDAVQETWLRLSRSDAADDREPRRLAHDGDGARLPQHAAVASHAT